MTRNVSLAACLLAASAAARVLACPYCTVESSTLTEEIEASDAVVLAKLIQPAAPVDGGPDELGEFGVVDPDTGMARFRIERVLLGQNLLAGVEEIEAVFFGDPTEGQTYFIRGVGADKVDWNIPLPVSEAAVAYIDQLSNLPPNGPERMTFFVKFLQHDDPLLAQDAYDEFARAPYADVVDIKDQIDRDQLWQWIEDRDVSPSRRSLFFTMLGVAGEQDDIARLHEMMLADVRVLRSAAEASVAAGLGIGGAITLPIVPEMVAMEQRRKQLGFNAMVGCYLKLTGTDGLDVVDDSFLKDAYADPTKVYGVLIALRFLGEQTDEVPLDRLKQSMRLVLEKPDFAEQAITDLARWEDWSVLDRLVNMFKDAPPRTYVKEPIVAYLDQASQQQGDVGERATEALAEIEQLDPDTVKRARSLMSFGFLARARTANPNAAPALTPDKPADDSAAEPSDGDASPDDEEPQEVQMAGTDSPSGEDSEVESPETEVADTAALADQPSTATAASEEETPEATAIANDDEPTTSAPSQTVLLAVPLLAAAVFAALMWTVLRGVA